MRSSYEQTNHYLQFLDQPSFRIMLLIYSYRSHLRQMFLDRHISGKDTVRGDTLWSDRKMDHIRYLMTTPYSRGIRRAFDRIFKLLKIIHALIATLRKIEIIIKIFRNSSSQRSPVIQGP